MPQPVLRMKQGSVVEQRAGSFSREGKPGTKHANDMQEQQPHHKEPVESQGRDLGQRWCSGSDTAQW